MEVNTVNTLIETIINVLLVPIITILSAYLVQLVKTKINLINDDKAKTQLNQAVDELQSRVLTAVNTVTQTYVDSLKKNGKFNVEEQQEALHKAYDLAVSMMTQGSLDYLIDELHEDGVRDLITSLIEQSIYQSKSNAQEVLIADPIDLNGGISNDTK